VACVGQIRKSSLPDQKATDPKSRRLPIGKNESWMLTSGCAGGFADDSLTGARN